MENNMELNLEQFIYLDRLRINGLTNMFGARPYLEEEFDLDRPTSTTILSAWMVTFDGSPVAERLQKALDTPA